MSEYKCKSCNYCTTIFWDMGKHLNRQKPCAKNLEGYKYSDEEILKISLIPYQKNRQLYDKKRLKDENNKYKISKPRFFELFHEIDKNKLKHCPLCKKNYVKKSDLKKHIIVECVIINCDEKSLNKIVETEIHNNIETDKTQNITNITNNVNITNNININNINNIQSPVSFDEEWDVSHLSHAEKTVLIISMYKYTKTLESLLKNKKNHNVVVDKKSQSGLIYKNNAVEVMSLNEICNKSFDKLNVHLNSFYDEIMQDNIYLTDPDLLKHEKKVLRIKYGNYQYYEKDKLEESNGMIEKFEEVKNDTLEKFNLIENN